MRSAKGAGSPNDNITAAGRRSSAMSRKFLATGFQAPGGILLQHKILLSISAFGFFILMTLESEPS
jgi:hypothetical protein